MDHPRFREGRLTTAFIAEEFQNGFAGVVASGADARKLQRSPPSCISNPNNARC
jgi:hypothetical protein